jgi:hypothetical protein
MDLKANRIIDPRVVKASAAVIIGLSIGMLVPPDPVSMPSLGPISGLIAGGLGLLIGGLLYYQVPRWMTSRSGCGCGKDCGCE